MLAVLAQPDVGIDGQVHRERAKVFSARCRAEFVRSTLGKSARESDASAAAGCRPRHAERSC